MTNQQQKDLLKFLGQGLENKKTREQISRFFGISDTHARRLIADLRDKGILVCSSTDREGYFIPILSRETELQIAKLDYYELRAKGRTIDRRADLMQKQIADFDEEIASGQSSLF